MNFESYGSKYETKCGSDVSCEFRMRIIHRELLLKADTPKRIRDRIHNRK